MSLRQLIHTKLTEEPSLTAEIPADRWKDRGAVLETPPRPFAVLAYRENTRGLKHVSQKRLDVWIHDEPGDYNRIEKILKSVRAILESGYGDSDPDTYLMELRWEGDSVDLFDDGHRTNAKYATFLLTGTGF